MAKGFDGIGVGLRREFIREILKTERQVDWLEIVPEQWMASGGRQARLLSDCLERWTIVPHGTSLSIGGPDPLDESYLAEMNALLDRVKPPIWSDHICYATVGGVYTHELLPLPFTNEAADHTIGRIQALQSRVEVPLVFENATFYAHMPGGTMDEATFLKLILEEADCGMLLDVNNVYVNSRNHGFDPRAFLDRMPYERVRQIHVAGHTRTKDLIIDTHTGPIIDEVWALYRYALEKAGRLIPTLIEWDNEIPPLDAVLDELDLARRHAADALEPARAIAAK
jgi:uncharacterized protein (UPF0276 family)